MRGNCYVTSEAAYHLLGGKEAGWVVYRMRHEGDTHWFIKNKRTGQRIDLTASQFKTPPNYDKAVAGFFLTKKPSKRAVAMMEAMLWQR